MTEIYVDILLVINYLVNTMLLGCLAKLSGRRPRKSGMIIAAITGALGSLTIFLPFSGFLPSMLERLLLSALMVRIAFRWRSWRGFLREWFIFFTVSFFFAGMMFAVWFAVKPSSMLYRNGVVYFDIPALLLVAMSALAYLLVGIFWRFSRSGRIARDSYEVRIKLGRRSVTVHAFVDTGNSLYEPFSGSPVIVCELEDIAPLLPTEMCEAVARRDFSGISGLKPPLRFIGYNAVGVTGMLPAFRADGVELKKDSGRFKVEDVYIAVSTDKLGFDGFSAILNPDLAGEKV